MRTAEELIRACWKKSISVDELIALLDDDREWTFGGYVNFDGDSETSTFYVSVSAVRALAEIAPHAASIDRIAATVRRMQGRTIEVQRCTYEPDYVITLEWTREELAPFGEALLSAVGL